MSVFVEEFVARLGWQVDNKKLDGANEKFKDLRNTILGVTAAITGAAAGVVAFVVATNKVTAVQSNTARAFGFSAEAVENWGYALSEIGITTESFMKSAKALNVQLGSMTVGAGQAMVRDSLKAIGVEYKNIKDLAPEKQFEIVAEAARLTTNSQTGLAVAQQLLGREGAKLVGHFRAQNRSFSDATAHAAALNLQTEEGRQGALDWYGAWDDLENILASVKFLLAGLIGGELSDLTKSFGEFVEQNRELIRENIKQWADRFISLVKGVWRVLKGGVDIIGGVIDAFGGLDKSIRVVGAALAGLAIFKAIGWFIALRKALAGVTLAQWLFNAAVGFWPLLVALAAAALYLIYDDIATYLRGGESLTGEIVEHVKGLWKEAVDVTEDYIGKAVQAIADLTGVTKTDLDQALLASWESLGQFFGQIKTWILEADKWWAHFFANFNLTDKVLGLLRKLPGFGDYFGGIADARARTAEDRKNEGVNWGSAPDANQWGEPITNLAPRPSAAAPASVRPTVIPTPAVVAAAASVNNSKSTKSISVSAPANITINQRPGENAENLANRIKTILEENVSSALSANDSGVEY